MMQTNDIFTTCNLVNVTHNTGMNIISPGNLSFEITTNVNTIRFSWTHLLSRDGFEYHNFCAIKSVLQVFIFVATTTI